MKFGYIADFYNYDSKESYCSIETDNLRYLKKEVKRFLKNNIYDYALIKVVTYEKGESFGECF